MEKFNSGKPDTSFSGRRYASHGVAVVGHLRSFGLLPAHGENGGQQRGESGGQQGQRGGEQGQRGKKQGQRAGAANSADGLLKDVKLLCWKVAMFCQDVRCQFQQALEMWGVVADCAVAVFGHDHIDVAVSRFNIGVLYRKEKKWGKVVECFEEAYRIRSKFFGHEHAKVTDTLELLNEAKRNFMQK